MDKINAPRGTADALPPASARWPEAETRMREVAGRFGYGEIRTPIFESTALFVRGVGEGTDIVDKEMYSFEDKGGRSITLRPEFTAPVVRSVLEHGLLSAGILRLFYIGPIFRYERPQAGRLRQAHQFGVECLGAAGPEADAEVILLVSQLLAEFGIAASLALNSIGDGVCRPLYRESLLEYLREHRAELSAESGRRMDRNPLRVLDSKEPQDQAIVAGAPRVTESLCGPCAEHFAGVRRLLEACGVAFSVDPLLARGLDYYTRTVFEFRSTALGAQNALCGGGRYDGLVESLGGPPTPAVGFALGIERLLMTIDALRGANAAAPPRAGIACLAVGGAPRARAFELAAELRNAAAASPDPRVRAAPIVMDFGAGKLENQLKRADKWGARMALILGEDEVAAASVALRDLSAREQRLVSVEEGWAGTVLGLYVRALGGAA